jgi:hypothetical protein
VRSPTRQNTDEFRAILKREGITRVLETNVVCYSTPMSADLRLPQHGGGESRGTEIFRTLLAFGKPRVIVAHGAGTRTALASILGHALPEIPQEPSAPRVTVVHGVSVFVIPSLAPPAWKKWQAWAKPHLKAVAQVALESAHHCGKTRDTDPE